MNSLCCVCVCFSCDSGGDCECLCTAIASYAEECNRRGVYIRWRSQELCRMSKSKDRHTHTSESSSFSSCNTLTPLQLCSVTTGWSTTPVGRRALPCVPASSRVHTLSAMFSPVWKAASALLARSYSVRQDSQNNPESPTCIFLCGSFQY